LPSKCRQSGKCGCDSAQPLFTDCRWSLDATVIDTDGDDCYMQLYMVEISTDRRTYTYCSEFPNVFLHWLRDGRTAILNNYEGADSAEPLVMILDGRARQKPASRFDMFRVTFQSE